MLVEAIMKGYYKHNIRKVGERFEIEKDKEFSETWMKKISNGEQSEVTEQVNTNERKPVSLSSGRKRIFHETVIDKDNFNIKPAE